MAIVSKPLMEGAIELYDMPDEELENYAISHQELARMFPAKADRSRGDAVSIASVQQAEGDVQAYGSNDICYVWECDSNGQNCVYVWWYC